jgi:signal transduction histidine kinase
MQEAAGTTRVRKKGLRLRTIDAAIQRPRVGPWVPAARRRSRSRALADRRECRLRRGVRQILAVLAGSVILFALPAPIHLVAPGARAALETLIAGSALVSAGLLLASFRQEHRRGDLLLLTALAVVGLTDFVFSALPALTGSELFPVGSGSQIACDALAAVAFVAVAFTPTGSLSRAGLGALRVAAAAAAATIGMATVTDVIAGQPALGMTTQATGITAAEAHPVLLAEAIFSSALLLIAGAVFFCRRESRSRMLGGAAYLLAASRLQYLALPAVAAHWLTAREGLRQAAYGLLLLVAVSRFIETRRALAATALAKERERIARDLHDGLAQDLSYIALQSQRLSANLGPEHPLTLAAQHAMAASRGVIVDLSASGATSLGAALRQVADELAARFGTEIDVATATDGDGAGPTELDPRQREDVVRIAREAIVNAARHGGAHHVALALEHSGDEVRLRVTDDGEGVPSSGLRGRGGYGLQMMRARAAGLGGYLMTRPAPQGGLEVELRFPNRSVSAR